MVGSDVFLYPETGPEFLRALKMAVLYSERVHSLTLTDRTLLESFLEHARQRGLASSKGSRQTYRTTLSEAVPILGAGVPVASTTEAMAVLSIRNWRT